MSYALRPGVHVCICADRAVFLDLPGDRYFCLPTDIDVQFRHWFTARAALEGPVLDFLIRAGIIAPQEGQQTPSQASAIAAPSDHLSDGDRIQLTWVLWAIFEQLLARASLRFSGLARIVKKLEANPTRRRLDDDMSASRIQRLAGAFTGSRLFIHSWNNCLSQSLAFRRACRRLNCDASLVIGVRLDPFAAHCWVQKGTIVLNDSIERVRHFTPILAA